MVKSTQFYRPQCSFLVLGELINTGADLLSKCRSNCRSFMYGNLSMYITEFNTDTGTILPLSHQTEGMPLAPIKDQNMKIFSYRNYLMQQSFRSEPILTGLVLCTTSCPSSLFITGFVGRAEIKKVLQNQTKFDLTSKLGRGKT